MVCEFLDDTERESKVVSGKNLTIGSTLLMVRSKAQMSTAVTVTMLCRILGAIICGVWSDWRGRKWTLAYTLWFLAIIQVATVYSRTFQEFLAVRALFGVGMGGVYVSTER